MRSITYHIETAAARFRLDAKSTATTTGFQAHCPFSGQPCIALSERDGSLKMHKTTPFFTGIHRDPNYANPFFKFSKTLSTTETTLTQLAIPVPAILLDALEHDSQAEYVAFYWEPAGDELTWCDGRSGGTGFWHPWLTYTRHPVIAPNLLPYDFGSSDNPARHWLIIDTASLTAYAAPVQQAKTFLQDQWYATGPDLIVITRQEVQAAMDAAAAFRDQILHGSIHLPTDDEFTQLLRRRDDLDARLATELNHHQRKHNS